MNRQIIVNLAVKDLEKSKAFFSALGFSFNAQYGSENTAMLVIVENSIHAMLMTEPFFQSLIDKPLLSAKEGNEVILCLTCDSKEELDGLIAKAIAAGGRTPHPPEDHGCMYTQGFEDIDGHLWNLVWAEPQA